MLPLDDPRWRELNHRGWAYGARYGLDPEAPFVPDELARLAEIPSDTDRFHDLWPYLCSEGTAWPAAFAAVPYVVELAKRLPPSERLEHLYFVGLVVQCGGPEFIKPYLEESYRRALDEAKPLLWETMAGDHGSTDTRYLLATAAALKGHPRIAEILDNLDCLSQECPRCGELVFFEALPEEEGPA